ncbi:DNA alkylation repair protein [Microbacteriaceae bacterium VKM Ac-2854]|nr:DNA alkylation repair protein [Microbacteriaceae bacterium VKM Ac-2854]
MGAMNELLGAGAIDGLAGALGRASGGAWATVRGTKEHVDPLALRQRSDLIAAAIIADHGNDYASLAAIFRAALDDPRFTGWMIWPVTEATVTLGREQDFDDALQLLAELTPRLSAEFAIRRLLAHDLDRALERIQPWTAHPDEHVRRLASEGTRAYLPWAIRVPALTARPEATIPILDALHADESEYVRRSVANHLNDLARHAPELVVETAGRWHGEGSEWVVRHGLRTLIKKADPGALALLGFAPVEVEVGAPVLAEARVPLPGTLAFSVSVRNVSAVSARLAVDYLVHYRKANGTLAPKVFKLAVADVAPGETRVFTKRHALRPMTTRVHHLGPHALEIQVNGARSGLTPFDLV